MLPPLLKAIAGEPALLLEHAGAYAELAGAEATALARGLRRRALLGLAAAVSAMLAVGLAGTAVLLAAAVPVEQMPRPELLWIVPGVPALVCLAALLRLQRDKTIVAFTALRDQVAQDAALWVPKPAERAAP